MVVGGDLWLGDEVLYYVFEFVCFDDVVEVLLVFEFLDEVVVE